jgi:thioester reductase-like protein
MQQPADYIANDLNPYFPEDGYCQSKWVAERLVKKASQLGLPVCIYRPGRLTGHSKIGMVNEKDILTLIIRLCRKLQTVPDLDLSLDLTPVDFASAALVHLSLHGGDWGRIYHLSNPVPAKLSDLCHWAEEKGHCWETVSLSIWREMALRFFDNEPEDALSLLQPWFLNSISDEMWRNIAFLSLQTRGVGCSSGNKLLDRTTIQCQRPNADLVDQYLRA